MGGWEFPNSGVYVRIRGMKFGRRAFLQFAAGAVGGTLLSPFPWKLLDDSAIWSQNWSWRPSPEAGEVTKVPTICTLCDGGCGIRAHLVSGNRAIALDGNPDHPVNQGGICALGAAGLQFLYAPYRVAQPMKQTKKRGESSGFQAISWKEALAELGARLSKTRSEGKPQSIACISGHRRSSMDELWQQFFSAYGSPNLFKMPAHSDSLKLAAALSLGQESSLAFALESATYVLSFGANLIEGWGAPGRMQVAHRIWCSNGTKPSAKVVQVESRCSMTAAKADQWVAISPGSEAALALGIAHILVKENLYDVEFVKQNVFGFEDWTDAQGKTRQGFKGLLLSKEYSPEEVSKQTGVEAAVVRDLAKEFASQERAVAVWGNNSATSSNNLYHDLSFLALNVLKGSLKTRGMITVTPSVPLGSLPELQLDDVAKRGAAQQVLDPARYKSVPLPGNALYAFLDTVAKGAPYPIEILLVHEANPAYSLPETQLFQAAVNKIGYLVSFSSYMDETALQADLILPNHCAFERYEDVFQLPGVPYSYYAVSSPVLQPRLDTKHSGDVLLELAKGLGATVAPALPWNAYEAYLKDRVKALASSGKGALAEKGGIEPWKLKAGEFVQTNYKDGSDLWKKLTTGLCWYDAPVDPLQNLTTSSGKVELAFQSLQKRGVAASEGIFYLPHFAPLKPSGDEKEYPFLLVSYQNPFISEGYLANPPFMTKTVWDFVLKGNDLFVELNPKTAKALGFNEGERGALKTPQGEVFVRVHIYPGAHPGAIYIVEGLGHKAYDEYIRDKGVNANSVIEVQMDPVTGQGTVWATRAQLRRA